jgi:hypothetical protein
MGLEVKDGDLKARGTALAHLSNNLKFYCSSFVVFVFNSAANFLQGSTDNLPFHADYRNILPKPMHAIMNKSSKWTEMYRGVEKSTRRQVRKRLSMRRGSCGW